MSNETSQQATINIEGMHCGNCVQKVTRALTGVPGVVEAQVDLAGKSATVRFDQQTASVVKLMQAVNGTGFKATGFSKQ